MSRGDTTVRTWRLLRLLDSPRGWTLSELEQKLGCSRRTVMRDLQAAQVAGFPIDDELDGREKRWRFVEGYESKSRRRSA